MPGLEIELPRLHPAQLEIKADRRRFNVICCGRRFGKNILLQDFTVESAIHGGVVGWAAPVYKQLLEDWRELSNVLAPVTSRRNSQEFRLMLRTGGIIDFWSLDNADSIRGRNYDRFIVNEAAFVPTLLDIWNMVIRPTLIDRRGDGYFAGTPKGMNGFFTLFRQDGDEWARWQKPSMANPFIPSDELTALSATMPEIKYRQEILAEFVEDGGAVFRRVTDAATATPQYEAVPGHEYVVSCDWGQTGDFTAFAVIDLTERALVHLDRFNQIDYELQKSRLLGVHRRFRPVQVVAEANSMGRPIIDSLVALNVPVVPFTTTNATKAAAIQALQLAFETGDIRIIPDPVLIGELQAYEQDRTPTGMPKYSAPEGMHDDTVMALAIGWQSIVSIPDVWVG